MIHGQTFLLKLRIQEDDFNDTKRILSDVKFYARRSPWTSDAEMRHSWSSYVTKIIHATI